VTTAPGPLPQGTLDLLILKTLASGPRHGYAVARWIEAATDDALSVEEGTLYPALYRLQHRKWVRAEWGRSELGKDIKKYELTAAGRRELLKRTAEWGALTTAVSKILRTS